ncbi:thioesterase II family protein [Streptomyces sp. AC154]|uniref:thioesterase II family protein n=1 Tax=Streptomyces sp. AC154 TaxID=3143184 RepID=UPI003F7F61E4
MNTPDVHSEAWIRRFHPADGRPVRLVCLPHAGGTASYFFPLSQRLADTADVLAVQYPGRQDRRREPPLESAQELATAIHTALRPYDDLPLVLFGHSMGAVLAFELARAMERAGTGPLGLIVSGRRSAALTCEDKVHTRGDAALLQEIRVLSGTDPGLLQDEEILSMVLPALRADFKAIETYAYRPDDDRSGAPLRCPVSVLTGVADPRVSLEQAMAWRELTTGEFSFASFPGGHFYLADQQDQVAEAITGSIRSFTEARIHGHASAEGPTHVSVDA